MVGMPLTDVLRSVETDGEAGLRRMGQGPFLVSVPVEGCLEPPRRASSSSTAGFEANLLLELRRSLGDGDDVWVYQLDDETVVGRDAGCRLAFAEDVSLSRTHATFARRGERWQVTDHHSRNGTFVQRDRVPAGTGRTVEALQVVQLGARRFVFVDVESLHALLADPEAYQPLEVSQLEAELATLGPTRFVRKRDAPHLLLAIEDHDLRPGLSFRPTAAIPLTGRAILRLGRTRQAEITVRNRYVSKWHGMIVHRGGHWSFQDTGARLGTRINGRRLASSERVRLQSWDTLVLGRQAWGLFVHPQGLLEFLDERLEDRGVVLPLPDYSPLIDPMS